MKVKKSDFMARRLGRAFLTQQLIDKVRLSEHTRKELATVSGLKHPSLLSDLLGRARTIEIGDPRIVALGRLLGVEPAGCFDPIRFAEADRETTHV